MTDWKKLHIFFKNLWIFVFRMEDLGQLQMVVVVFGIFVLGNLIWANLGASELLKFFKKVFKIF